MTFYKWSGLDKVKAEDIERMLFLKGSLTYKEMCNIIGVPYIKEFEELIFKEQQGLMDFRLYCKEVRKIQKKYKIGEYKNEKMGNS